MTWSLRTLTVLVIFAVGCDPDPAVEPGGEASTGQPSGEDESSPDDGGAESSTGASGRTPELALLRSVDRVENSWRHSSAICNHHLPTMNTDANFEATAMPDPDWWHALWPDPTQVLRQVGLGLPGQRVLDLCCGDGHFTVPLAQLSNAEVVAVDLDPAMLGAARHLSAEAGVTNVRFIEGDAMKLAEIAGGTVDAVLVANTLHGAPDKTALAHQVRAVLAPGGTFVVINWWPRPREQTTVLGKARGPREQMRFSPTQVADWLQPAGFELDRIEDVGPYHYGAVFRLEAAQPRLP